MDAQCFQYTSTQKQSESINFKIAENGNYQFERATKRKHRPCD